MVANIITKINLDVPEAEQYAPLQIATAVSMTVGLIQLLLFLFRMGALSSLLSDPLVKGFTTGAAIHIIVSQLKDLFGITITAYNGPFNVILTVIDVLKGLGRTNWVALVVSVVVIVFMYLANDYAKPYLFKKYKFPLPTELMVVIGGTLASKYMELGPKNGLSLIGTIPTG
jgi:solute carrier family 26, other